MPSLSESTADTVTVGLARWIYRAILHMGRFAVCRLMARQLRRGGPQVFVGLKAGLAQEWSLDGWSGVDSTRGAWSGQGRTWRGLARS